MKMKWISLVLTLVFVTTFANTRLYAKNITLKSPNGQLFALIEVGDTLSFSLYKDSEQLIEKVPLVLSVNDGFWGVNPKLLKERQVKVVDKIQAAVYKKKEILDSYNQLTLQFKGDYSVVFRAYDEGVAYRFVSTGKKELLINNELFRVSFPENNFAYIPYVKNKGNSLEEQFFNSFENVYAHNKLSEWDKDRLAFLPILIEANNGSKICITEADLLNYPGMYLHNADGGNTLNGVFAPYPKKIRQGGHNMLQGVVEERENYIARVPGTMEFPWRIFIVANADKELLDNDMVYKLASPNPDRQDFSWIKPGKVAWDWWNAWNLYGVDFNAGINNETYKHYIDFAAKNGVEYVILDEGWAVNKKADLMDVVPEIDLKELVAYANERNVGLILWAGYYALDRDLENICRHYADMGIKGFKVDFMDRDDQPMVNFHKRAAQVGAKYNLLMDFHGTYKPTGLQRTYPNVINFEGVHGLEQLKWGGTDLDQVPYDVIMPYIRMVAGPIDYTQGAMRNAGKSNFRPINSEAMSQGTRCRQLGEYVIFESPLNMLCDNPSNYEQEQECTEFISNIPTVWDETIALDGKIGEYIVMARRKGDVWYIGGLTNWNERPYELDLSFLENADYELEIYKDGINANKAARDYKKETLVQSSAKPLKLWMAEGGGFAIKLKKM